MSGTTSILTQRDINPTTRLNRSASKEFEPEKKWWKRRKESELAWKVPIKDIIDNNYNLDIKNPHDAGDDHGDPAELLADYKKLMTDLGKTRDSLRDELASCLEKAK